MIDPEMVILTNLSFVKLQVSFDYYITCFPLIQACKLERFHPVYTGSCTEVLCIKKVTSSDTTGSCSVDIRYSKCYASGMQNITHAKVL